MMKHQHNSTRPNSAELTVDKSTLFKSAIDDTNNKPSQKISSDVAYRSLYFDFLKADNANANAHAFLEWQLARARTEECDLPEDSRDLSSWAEQNVIAAGIAYDEYREARKQGAPRRFFSNKSHALYFLRNVAPSKLVDGAWLYGVLQHWQDSRYEPLIRIYLEELGDGLPEQNHVALFRKLLSINHCDGWEQLDNRYFLQGAIQLAIGQTSDQFLPEMIGFNLGYEQLPLHLLITAYELIELGIDPYYFTLHITIDNLASGHAKQALDSVINFMPTGKAGDEFYSRMRDGYRLNALGESTCAIIESFDAQTEVLKIFQRKAQIGQFMHSDRCNIGGRAINDWLSTESGVAELLERMQASGWIKRHQDPLNSKFWRLIRGDQPLMFGVFTAYEQQVIFDWIAGDQHAEFSFEAMSEHHEIFPRPSANDIGMKNPVASIAQYRRKGKIPQFKSVPTFTDANGLADFEELLAASNDLNKLMQHLIGAMSPDKHSLPLGLHATQVFKKLYDSAGV